MISDLMISSKNRGVAPLPTLLIVFSAAKKEGQLRFNLPNGTVLFLLFAIDQLSGYGRNRSHRFSGIVSPGVV